MRGQYKGVLPMFYWVESWVPWLNKWCSTEAFYNVHTARTQAERGANAYHRVYRVTDENRREHGRFTGET